MNLENRKYGGFGRRLLAHLIENVFHFVVIFLCFFLYEILTVDPERYHSTSIENLGDETQSFTLFSILASILFVSLMESSKLKASVGKLIMGLEVVDREGRKLSFLRAFGKNCAKFLCYFVMPVVIGTIGLITFFVLYLGGIGAGGMASLSFSQIAFVIGYFGTQIVVAVCLERNEKKQGLADFMAKTLVVRRS